MFWSIFDASEAKQCGFALAEIVMIGYPESERKTRHKAKIQKVKVLNQVFAHARQFQQEKRPNFYKKAKLANVFRWKLLDEGFESAFVQDLTHQLLIQLK